MTSNYSPHNPPPYVVSASSTFTPNDPYENNWVYAGSFSSSTRSFPVMVCLVCEAATDSHFCSLCRSALLQLRKEYVAETVEVLLEEEGTVRLHQAFTATGNLTHAVRLIRRGKYQERAICGVRIVEAKARKFESGEKGALCSRCMSGLGAA